VTVESAVNGVPVAPFAARHRPRRQWVGWLFVLPVVVGTLVFNVLPMAPTLFLSLTDWDGGFTDLRLVGINNYAKLLNDSYFIGSVQRTFLFVALTVTIAMASGLFLAMLVRTTSRANSALRAVYFLPFITSQVAIGLVWRWIFNHNAGPVSGVLDAVGVAGPRWLLQPETAFGVLVLVTSWLFTGYNMVLFLSGLQRIPGEVLEAATIDGAGPLARFRHIVFPLLSPTTFFVLVVNIIIVFEVFGLIFVLTDGGPGTATEVYMYRLYREAFQFFHLGYASAMAWILIVILTTLSAAQFALSRRWVFYQ